MGMGPGNQAEGNFSRRRFYGDTCFRNAERFVSPKEPAVFRNIPRELLNISGRSRGVGDNGRPYGGYAYAEHAPLVAQIR